MQSTRFHALRHALARWRLIRRTRPLSAIGRRLAALPGGSLHHPLPMAAVILMAPLGLAACVPFGVTDARPRPTPVRVAVSGQQVVITGPWGFCVDPSATRDTKDTAFVLLGNCAAISHSVFSPQPRLRAVLTASVVRIEPGPGKTRNSLRSLEKVFHTHQGLAMLSRDGSAKGVEVLATFQRQGMLFVQAKAPGGRLSEAAGDKSWHAYFTLNGRLVTISVIGLASAPLKRSSAIAALTGFHRAIMRATKSRAKTA